MLKAQPGREAKNAQGTKQAERLRKLKALHGREAKNAQGTKQSERLRMLKALSRPRG